MEAGVYFDVSNSDYHSGPAVSKTALDKVAKSPAHYFAHYLDPNRPPPPEPTPAMLAGTLAHCAILEPAQFDSRYIITPAGIDRRTKDGKAALEAFQAQANGRKVVTQEQRDKAFAQAESIRKLPDVAEALAHGHAEVSAYWIDDVTGMLCKCRPDFVHDCGEAGVILFDIKTTADASFYGFRRSVANFRYHVQAAYYTDGFEKASGRKVLAFVFAAVENEWPHIPSAMMLDPASMQEGRKLYRRDLDTLADCTRTNTWPGYSTAIETISLPAWALTPELATITE